MCAITLIINMLENIEGLEASMPNIIDYFVKELSGAETPDYKCMLMQGFSMCIYYNS